LAKLRQKVFIVEQNSIYTDVDDHGQAAIHYLGNEPSSKLIIYARYRQDNSTHDVKIERVVLDKSARGKGLGKQLIKIMLNDIKVKFPEITIVLSSQLEVGQFYSSLVFNHQGDAGIDHISLFYPK
jgi:ElaA protein